jgi:hypothetical protein
MLQLLQPLNLLEACLFTLLGGTFIKRRYLSSISDIPGPFWGSFSILWQLLQIVKGHTEAAVIKEHKKHGTTFF